MTDKEETTAPAPAPDPEEIAQTLANLREQERALGEILRQTRAGLTRPPVSADGVAAEQPEARDADGRPED